MEQEGTPESRQTSDADEIVVGSIKVFHSVAECEIDDCPDCDEFWRDEYADVREGD